jgi:hypothetical protein
VRLAGYIVVEATLAGSLLIGVGAATARGVWYLRAVLGDHRAAVAAADAHATAANLRAAAPALRSRAELSSLPDLRVALESSGTFLGMSDELLLDRIRNQPLARFKLNHGGSSLSFRVEFADGSRAAWKPTQTNLQTIPRKEVAAYRLNRLLGMNAVPPAAPRAVSREELLTHLHPDSLPSLARIQAETVFGPTGKTVGAASYWIPVIKDSGFDVPPGRQQAEAWLTQGESIPMEQREMAAQLSDLVVFDFLTDNPDRYSGGNMKMSGDGSQLFFMDNTMSFFVDPEGKERNRLALLKTQRFSAALSQALDRVDVETLRRAFAEEGGSSYEILTEAEIKAVVARRGLVRRHIDQLIGQYGEKAVLAFP